MNLVSTEEMVTVVGGRGNVPFHGCDLGEPICILSGSRTGPMALDCGAGALQASRADRNRSPFRETEGFPSTSTHGHLVSSKRISVLKAA